MEGKNESFSKTNLANESKDSSNFSYYSILRTTK